MQTPFQTKSLLQNVHSRAQRSRRSTCRDRAMEATDFIVARQDLHDGKFIETKLPDADALPDEALLVKVESFAFTANNITYATLGDQLKYWQLFPASPGFGNVPVWGFGEVVASRHPAIE